MIRFPNDFLKGTVEITDNLMLAKESIFHQPADLRVVMLSEEDDLSPNHPNVIKAACLLPPVMAQIAEADGKAEEFLAIYSEHLGRDPFNSEFIMALIMFIHRGGSIMFYCKDLTLYSNRQFIMLMNSLYGIYIPITGSPEIPVYNYRHMPQWLLGLFRYHIIDPTEFCVNYPLDAEIPVDVMDILIEQFGIYADSYEDAIKQMKDYHIKIHKNPLVQNALISTNTYK